MWCQANNFQNNTCSILFSIADIPLTVFNFKGFICVLILDGKEYRFATYNRSKIKKYQITNNVVNVLIEKGAYSLYITCHKANGIKLSAPVKGNMQKNILETIDSTMNIVFRKNNHIIYSGTSSNAGLEIVEY